MRRRVARWVFAIFGGTLAAALGTATALPFSPPGRRLLARVVTEFAPTLIRGSLSVTHVGGSFVSGLVLDSVVIRDTAGVLLAEIPRLTVGYQLPGLAAGRVVLNRVTLTGARIYLWKHRGGRVNLEEVLRLGEGNGTGESPLVELRDLRLEDASLELRVPWNPDGRLRTARERDSALAHQRGRPGRRIVEGPEGLEQVRTWSGITAAFPVLRLSTPERDPLTIVIAEFAARMSDPAVTIRELRGTVSTGGDSLRFELERVALPATEGSGFGRLEWPRDTVLLQFTFEAPTFSLADLRWVSSDFPDLKGRVRIGGQSVGGGRAEYDIRNLDVRGDDGRVRGRLVAVTDRDRGLGFRDLDLTLDDFDLDVVRPYLDTVPFQGRLTGGLKATGFFDGMDVGLDWRFRDGRLADGAESRLALDGRVELAGAEGFAFRDAGLTAADLDLPTIRQAAPAVTLEGRLGLEGRLDGPWKNVWFTGAAVHTDGERPASRMTGRLRLDTRGRPLALEADVRLDSLAFDGIRRGFPTLPTQGRLGGRVRLSGPFDHLRVNADLEGALGRVKALGQVALTPPRWKADSLRLDFERLDLAALRGGGAHTSLTGQLDVTGVTDSAAAPRGELRLALGPGRFREVALSRAEVRLRVRDSVIEVDTLTVRWEGGRVDGGGSLGWAGQKTGRLALRGEAITLAAFDSLAIVLTGLARDSTVELPELRGRARADLVLTGALGALRAEGELAAEDVTWLGLEAHRVTGSLRWSDTSSARFAASLALDSLRAGRMAFDSISARAEGSPAGFTFSGTSKAGGRARLEAGGGWTASDGVRTLRLDRLNLELMGRAWRLAAPAVAVVGDSGVALDTVRFETNDGAGTVTLTGEVPGRRPGVLGITALGVGVRDVYALLQRDTTGIAGSLSLDLRVGGTSRAPTIRGSASATGTVFGDFRAPLVRSVIDYEDRRLRSNFTFWRTGRPVVEVDATLPLDLALERVPRRQLPGPVSLVARGDSIDLAVVEAYTQNLRRVTGRLDVDARVEGTWEAPRLAGFVRITSGAADVPGLGVRYGPVNGTLRLAGDSILADSVQVRGQTGDLIVDGGIRLERLTRPVLALELSARAFTVMDVRHYLTLRAWGDLTLTGPVARPVLRGRGSLENSVIYFADLVQKDIINLEDPALADLVDTTALRAYDLRANFQSRFLDSLSIQDLEFRLGEGVWLRSNEANIQLEGSVRVNKVRRDYRIAGGLTTPRGTYTLKLGPVTKSFAVEQGTVRYFGTSDLNAELDIRARHLVRTPQGGEDLPIVARITGTLLVPRLAFTSPDRPQMGERDLIAMLMVGTTNLSGGLSGTENQALEATLAVLSGALSSELERALISGGAPLDMVEIRPGLASSGLQGGVTATQFAVGRQLGRKWFVTANAGFCSFSEFSARNLGANLEYRIKGDVTFLLSAEPVQTCTTGPLDAFATSRRYQFGAELRWDRNY